MLLPSSSTSFREIEDQRLVQAMNQLQKGIRLGQLQGEACLQAEEDHLGEVLLEEAWDVELHLDL
jgi:hypothetical protein